jgi:hypothetical protein
MKTNFLILALAALPGLTGVALAQNTFPASGNVGIGTTNPTAPLTVSSANTFSGTAFKVQSRENSDAYNLSLRAFDTPLAGIHWSFDLVNAGITYPDVLTFNHSKVGIGNAGPQVPLDVAGTAQLDGDGRHILYLTDDSPFGSGVGAGISLLGSWNAAGNRATFGAIKGIKENAVDGNRAGALALMTVPNAGSPTERMRITSEGKVGIGTPNPRASLHIVHDSTSLNAILISTTLSGNAPWMAIGHEPVTDSFQIAASHTGTGAFLPLTFWTDDRERIRISAQGDVGIGTAVPQAKLDVNGKINCTVLELTSDRNAKAGFAAVDNRELLQKVASLPLSTWHYTNAPGVRHLGPMAQDFQAAFHLGTDDKHIATVDADGVALAAIQGLYELVQEKDARIAALEQKLAQTDILTARIAALEKMFADSIGVQKSSNPGVSSPLQGSEGTVPQQQTNDSKQDHENEISHPRARGPRRAARRRARSRHLPQRAEWRPDQCPECYQHRQHRCRHTIPRIHAPCCGRYTSRPDS